MKQKRKYNKARLKVVQLSGRQQLLAGSDAGGGGNAPQQLNFTATSLSGLGDATTLQ